MSDDLETRAVEQLARLKREAAEKGRSGEEVESDRREMRAQGRTDHQIAAVEFAELRMFADFDNESEAVTGAVMQGTPSGATMALVEREGYCSACVRHWYHVFAEAFRTGMRS